MTAPTAPGAGGRQEVCLACGKPWSAHTPLYDDCPMFIADGALSYNQQLEMMAELNGWMYRANQAEAAVEDALSREAAERARADEAEQERDEAQAMNVEWRQHVRQINDYVLQMQNALTAANARIRELEAHA